VPVVGAYIQGEIVASRKIALNVANFSARETEAWLEALDGWLASSHVLQAQTIVKEINMSSYKSKKSQDDVVGGCGCVGCPMMYYHEHVGNTAPPPETSEFWADRPQLVNRKGETFDDILKRRADGYLSDSD
jgi:hypothetical protein